MRSLRRAAVIFCFMIFAMAVVAGCGRRTVTPDTEAPAQSGENGGSGESAQAQRQEDPQTESTAPQTDPADAIHAPSMTAEEYPSVDGSTATLPLSQALYRLVTGASGEEAEANVVHTKTSNAYRRLMEGNTYEDSGVALVLAYEPSPSVYEEMEASGVKLNIKPIGKDALVFMTNAGNPVKSLTGEQLTDIYSGRIKNWSQAGGENKEILAFQRPVDSGSQTLMEKLVMRGIPMAEAPKTSVATDMGELIDRVASYNNRENALGYSVYFYARNMYQSPGLRFMAVDGVSPSNGTIRDGSYPYVNEFYAAVRADEPRDSAAHRLFDWLTGDDGQALIGELGYVSLRKPEKGRRLVLGTEPGTGPQPGKGAETGMQPGVGAQSGTVTRPGAVTQPGTGPQPDTGEAKIQLAQDERILLDGRIFYGTDGVMVLDGDMKVERKLQGVSLSDRIEVADIREPVILTSTANDEKGLYDLAKDVWALEPGYANVYRDGDGVLRAYRSDTEKGYMIEFGEPGGEVSLKEIPLNRVGDHYWEEDLTAQTARITDLDGAVVKTVNFRDFLDYEYGYTAGACFVARDEKWGYVIFDEKGEAVFTVEDLAGQWPGQILSSAAAGREIELYPESVSQDGKWILMRFVGIEESFIYSVTERKAVTGRGSKIEVYLSDGENCYIVTADGKTVTYGSDGRPVRSRGGRDFSFALGDGYYAYQDGNMLCVEHTARGTAYRLPVEKVIHVYTIAGDTFMVRTENQSYIFQKETCLMKGPETGWWASDDYVVAGRDSEENIVLRKEDGEILYRSAVPENVLRPFPELLAVTRGNYLCLLDYRGRCALKLLAGEMTDD